MKSLTKIGLIGSMTCLLFACQRQPDKIDESIHTQTQTTENQIEAIQVAEENLQTTFSKALEEKDIAGFNSHQEELNDNIDSRQNAFDDLTDANKQIENDLKDMQSALDNSELSAAEQNYYKQLSKETQDLHTNLSDYLNQYQNVLKAEADFYQKIGADDADYQTFADGSNKINSTHQEAQSHLPQIQEKLQQIHQMKPKEEG